MRGVIGALVLGLAVATVSPRAEACSCLPWDVIRDYNQSDEVVIGTIVSSQTSSGYRVYTVRIHRDLKGCRTTGSLVRIGTPASGASCGIALPSGTPMLLFADWTTVRGQNVLMTTMCKTNKGVSRITADERDYLESRPVTCGGVTTCNDGSSPYSCLIDPCSVATPCAGATCEANYCGGCTAEFYYPTGEGACMPW